MSNTPSAKVADGRLVLNLPDAETPALWIMDLADAQTSVIRLEADAKGLFVLKKHGVKGAETVAVYRNREAGTNALDIAAKALEKARSTRIGGGSMTGCSRAGRIFTYFIMVWFFLYSIQMVPWIMYHVLTPFMSQKPVVLSGAGGNAPRVPATQGDTQVDPSSGAGVPLSADDFLKSQSAPQ